MGKRKIDSVIAPAPVSEEDLVGLGEMVTRGEVPALVGQVVPVKRDLGVVLAHYSALPQSEDAPCLATWPLDTPEGVARLSQATEGLSISIWDACETAPYELLVQDLAVTYGEYEDPETPGEIIRGPMMHLISPEASSRVYHTGSEWAYRSLQRLAALIGPPPWSPPVRLMASRQGTRNRRTRQALVFVGLGEK